MKRKIFDYFEDIYKLRKVDFYFFQCWMFDEEFKEQSSEWLMGNFARFDSISWWSKRKTKKKVVWCVVKIEFS